MVKGTNITIYVDNETLAWLDQMCGVMGITRGKLVSKILRQTLNGAQNILLSGAANPELIKKLKKMLKDSI